MFHWKNIAAWIYSLMITRWFLIGVISALMSILVSVSWVIQKMHTEKQNCWVTKDVHILDVRLIFTVYGVLQGRFWDQIHRQWWAGEACLWSPFTKVPFSKVHSNAPEGNDIRAQRGLVIPFLSEATVDPSKGLIKGQLVGLDICQGNYDIKIQQDNEGNLHV